MNLIGTFVHSFLFNLSLTLFSLVSPLTISFFWLLWSLLFILLIGTPIIIGDLAVFSDKYHWDQAVGIIVVLCYYGFLEFLPLLLANILVASKKVRIHNEYTLIHTDTH